MLGDSKAEVARLAEVPPDELKLLHLESRLQELQRLISSHSHMTRDLLVTSDREGSHCVPCLGEDRLLTCCCYCCHTHTHTHTERECVYVRVVPGGRRHSTIHLVSHMLHTCIPFVVSCMYTSPHSYAYVYIHTLIDHFPFPRTCTLSALYSAHTPPHTTISLSLSLSLSLSYL